MKRGEVWWASLPPPIGRRPVLIVQANAFNETRIRSVVIALITSNLGLEGAPGNVRLPAGEAGLPKACVVNVSQIYTVARADLTERLGAVGAAFQQRVDAGLRHVLDLPGGQASVMEAAAEYVARKAGKVRVGPGDPSLRSG